MEFKPLAGLTRGTCVLQELCVAGAIASIFTDYYDYRCYSELGPEVDPAVDFVASDAVSGVLALVYGGLVLVCMVFFLMWVFRVNKNLRRLSHAPMVFTPGWAVGWFFIPVACLWKPYQAMREIWRVSHRDANAPLHLLGWWWLLSLLSSMMGMQVARSWFGAETSDDYACAALVSVGCDVVDAVAAFLTVLVVKRIAAAYEENFVEPCADFPTGGPVLRPPPLPPAVQ